MATVNDNTLHTASNMTQVPLGLTTPCADAASVVSAKISLRLADSTSHSCYHLPWPLLVQALHVALPHGYQVLAIVEGLS